MKLIKLRSEERGRQGCLLDPPPANINLYLLCFNYTEESQAEYSFTRLNYIFIVFLPQSSCSNDGLVCGVNGETYSSQCAAWADHVSVDYEGNCSATGHLVAGRDNNSVCDGGQCPQQPDEPWCRKITPPGGCCSICGMVHIFSFGHGKKGQLNHNCKKYTSNLRKENIRKKKES